MSSHLNLIGSIIIGGLLFLTINRFSASMTQNSQERLLDSITGKNIDAIARVIEFDFNRIGLGVPGTTQPIIRADSTRITFLSDINENGVVDTLRYILSDTSSANGTQNPIDKILYRVLNDESQNDAALGVTKFKLKYFTFMGYETSNLSQIRTIEISLTVESTIPYDNRYSRCLWQSRFSPPNLARY